MNTYKTQPYPQLLLKGWLKKSFYFPNMELFTSEILTFGRVEIEGGSGGGSGDSSSSSKDDAIGWPCQLGCYIDLVFHKLFRWNMYRWKSYYTFHPHRYTSRIFNFQLFMQESNGRRDEKKEIYIITDPENLQPRGENYFCRTNIIRLAFVINVLRFPQLGTRTYIDIWQSYIVSHSVAHDL